MAVLERITAGTGLVFVGMAFLRLARSDVTDRSHLRATEYGFALALVAAGVGLVGVTAVGSLL